MARKVLTMKAGFTLRAYLTIKITRKSAMKNKYFTKLSYKEMNNKLELCPSYFYNNVMVHFVFGVYVSLKNRVI